ncbi:MAG TPA: class I SAM-dependent methyltransferase [Baekduia sp.]
MSATDTYINAGAAGADGPAPACPACGGPLDGPVLLAGPDRLHGKPGHFSVIRCAGCGLASTVPRLGLEDFAEYYPETYHAYEPLPEQRRRRGLGRLRGLGIVNHLRLEAVLRLGPYRPLFRRGPGRLLDVGCGTGDLALAFDRHGWSVAGVEPSAAACTHAVAAGMEVHNGTLDDHPWQPASFDAVVFNHSLEHIPDPLDALRRAADVVKPGGMVAVAVPNFGAWHRRAFGPLWYQLDLPRHLQHFDGDSLAGLMRRAGLRPVATTTASMRPSLLMSLQYVLFGRARLTGRPMRLITWAATPLILLIDRFAAGDCVHVFAVRDDA